MKELLKDLGMGIWTFILFAGFVFLLTLLHALWFNPVELQGIMIPLYAISLLIWISPVLGLIGLGRIIRQMRKNDQA